MFLLSHNKNIVSLYVLFIISVMMNFIPSIAVQTFGGILFFVVFVATYIVRSGKEKNSIDVIHCNYIIKTVWIFSLMFIVGTILSVMLADHTAIMNVVNIIEAGNIPNEDILHESIVMFGMDNLILFLIIFLPMIFYVLYRFGKGLHLVRQDKIPANPKGWF